MCYSYYSIILNDMPTFTKNPTAVVTDLGNDTRQLDFTWSTDQPCVAVFALMQQGQRDNWNDYVPQTTIIGGTEFNYTTIRPKTAVEFYGIKITANGQDAFYYAQMPFVSPIAASQDEASA